MDKELEKKIKYLHLPALLKNWGRYMQLAKDQNYSNTKFLKYVIEEEFRTRKENSRQIMLRNAKIPELLVMETFPFDKQPNLNRKKILEEYDSFDYILKKQNLIWVGPTGCGKTGLATSFLVQAINRGHSGRFITFSDLIEMLNKSRGDYSEGATIKKIAAYDCLLIDELGYIEMEPSQVGLFFSLMQKRHKTKTTIITTNLGFQEWDSFLKNSALTAALIDRLTENSHVMNMKKCVSLRPKLPQYLTAV